MASLRACEGGCGKQGRWSGGTCPACVTALLLDLAAAEGVRPGMKLPARRLELPPTEPPEAPPRKYMLSRDELAELADVMRDARNACDGGGMEACRACAGTGRDAGTPPAFEPGDKVQLVKREPIGIESTYRVDLLAPTMARYTLPTMARYTLEPAGIHSMPFFLASDGYAPSSVQDLADALAQLRSSAHSHGPEGFPERVLVDLRASAEHMLARPLPAARRAPLAIPVARAREHVARACWDLAHALQSPSALAWLVGALDLLAGA